MLNAKEASKKLFRADYLVSDQILGGIIFNISLVIDSETKSILGVGKISHFINSSLNIPTEPHRNYSYMCAIDSCNILIVAVDTTTYEPMNNTKYQFSKNIIFRMSLNQDWKTGYAAYKHFSDGEWKESVCWDVQVINSSEQINHI